MIVYVSRVMGGSESDKTHFNESEAPDLLEERYGKEGRSGEEQESGRGRGSGEERGREEEGEKEKEVKLTLVLGGDKAYRGVQRPLGWKNMVTKSAEKEERKEMREKEKEERKKARETRKKALTLPTGCDDSSPTVVAPVTPSDTSSHSHKQFPSLSQYIFTLSNSYFTLSNCTFYSLLHFFFKLCCI
jgi:hypothetical protein